MRLSPVPPPPFAPRERLFKATARSAEEKVECTDSERERDGKRGSELGSGGGREQVKKWYSQIPTVVHFFGYRRR